MAAPATDEQSNAWDVSHRGGNDATLKAIKSTDSRRASVNHSAIMATARKVEKRRSDT